MPTVTIRLFARLAQLAGTREAQLDIEEGLTAGDALHAVEREYPALAGLGPSVMLAVNREYVEASHPLADGDELALIPPVSGGAPLFEVTSAPLDAARLLEEVRRDEAGAVVLFYGVVRNENIGRRVLYLEYDGYPEMAEETMRQIAAEIFNLHGVTAIGAHHRTGRLEIGETSLLVAVSSPHRAAAFEAAHAYVDRLKEVVPIWKKEVFEGGEEWIEGPKQNPQPS